MKTLTNDFLTVQINPLGAELQSVIDNHSQHEYLWQADPAVWKRHAPVLFPIVGALKDAQYTYQGQTYPMGQHGFARDREFAVVTQSETAITFRLTDDEESRKVYPFAFALEVSYRLDNNQLHVGYQVTNPASEAPLYFSIGGHPGFNIPLSDDTTFEDYYFGFEPRKSQVTIPLTEGGVDYAHRTLAATDVNQRLTHDTFKNDAVIYELQGKTKFVIRSDKTKHGVSVSMPNAKYLGVWSPYPTTGEFVCIEPWWGIADTVDASGELTEKLGINKLDPQGTFSEGYTISIF